MKTLALKSHSYEETLRLGAKLAHVLKSGDIVCLFGDLGAGKTAFTKGMAKGLKIDPNKVHSPTFMIMNQYKGKVPVHHFDLYRIGEGDLLDMGYEEFFYTDALVVIEWSERLGSLLPENHLMVELKHVTGDNRIIRIAPYGVQMEKRWERVIKVFS